jgi:tetratricopeptide (TPR) repeat protein
MGTTQTDSLFDQAMAALNAKREAEAEELFLEVVRADPEHEQAWFWLAGLVESLNQAAACLHRVLALNPANTHAREWLDMVEQEQGGQAQTMNTSSADGVRAVPRLGAYLVHQKLITEQQLNEALAAQDTTRQAGAPKRVGEILVSQGLITQAQLEEAVHEQYRDVGNLFED